MHHVLGDPVVMQFSDGIKSREQVVTWIKSWIGAAFMGGGDLGFGLLLRSRRNGRLGIAA